MPSQGSVIKERPSALPQIVISHFGKGGKRVNTPLNPEFLDKHLKPELIDRWIAFTIFTNEVELIEEALEEAPDHPDLKKELAHFEKLLYKAAVDYSGLQLQHRQEKAFEKLEIRSDHLKAEFREKYSQLAEKDFQANYGDNSEITD